MNSSKTLTAEHGPHEVVKHGEFQILSFTTLHLTDPPEWGGEYAHEVLFSFKGKGERVMGFGDTEAEAVAEAYHLVSEAATHMPDPITG